MSVTSLNVCFISCYETVTWRNWPKIYMGEEKDPSGLPRNPCRIGSAIGSMTLVLVRREIIEIIANV